MRNLSLVLASLLTTAIAVAPATAQDKSKDESKKPLVIASEAAFFIGGESKTLGNGEITVNQMYVQYQTPANAAMHLPVVMVHGCCLSSKTWETTPDGRMGWNEYFRVGVRIDPSIWRISRLALAPGFDPSVMNGVRSGAVPPSQLPNVLAATHQTAWSVFRFGPAFNKPFPDGQFPIEAIDELYKQMIPDLNSTLPNPNPTWKNMAALAVKVRGAVLIGHSESGFFPEQAALIDPSGVKGIVSIEMPCATDLSETQISTLAKIPTLVMFGDHLGDVQGGIANWANSFDTCQKFVDQVKKAGGDAQMMHLPKLGIHGNSHMLMQDKNNLQLADLILGWIDDHVEKKGTRPAK